MFKNIKKKILFIIILTSLFLLTANRFVKAIDSTSSAKTATKSAENPDKAKDLVNKINDKVAQMGLNLKKSYSGKIRSLGNNTITLTYDSGEIVAEANDATNFYRLRAGKRSTIDFKSLKVGSDLTIIGILDEGSHTLISRTVIDKVARIAIFGKVTQVSKGTLTISLPDGKKQDVDTSGATIKKLSAKKEITTGRASDISADDYVSVIGYLDDDTSTTLTALKIFILPQAILFPTSTPSAPPTPSPTPKPSPTTKPSPTVKPKI